MSRKATTVLLVGATGTFGRLLARQLMDERGIKIILAGRTRKTLEALQQTLGDGPTCVRKGGTKGCPAGIAVLDRDQATPDDVIGTGADIVIDAAGPFQDSRMTLVESAIAAGCHYIDLADGRAFVAQITRFDTAARDRGVAVLSGASTSPALTTAIIDNVTRQWQRIDTLRVALTLGSKAPRGLSVVQAALSYAGRPIRVFREGRWTHAPGWGLTRHFTFPGLGRRRASLCETPDLDVLPARFKPRVAAEFFAGVEQPFLHRILGLASLLVRARLLSSLRPLARIARRFALLFAGMGDDRGGLLVEAKGQDGQGKPTIARWSMAAPPGKGPFVPTLAALALVRRLHHGTLDFTGAAPCVGFLKLADFTADFARIGIVTDHQAEGPPPPLFANALGDAFGDLYLITQDVHRPDPVVVLRGEAEVDGATNPAGRLIARLFRFPPAASRTPISVIIEAMDDADGGSEAWSRVYPTRVMRSVMSVADPAARSVQEGFGLFRFRLRLDVCRSRMALTPVAAWWGKLPIPRLFHPRIVADERAAGGRHHFDVSIALPVIGRLVHYRGWLALEANKAPSK